MNHPKTFTESEKSWQCYSACTACLSKQSPSAKCRNPSGSEQHGLDLSPEEQEPVSISIPRLVPDWLNGKFAGIIRNRNISLEKPWFPAELVLSTLHEWTLADQPSELPAKKLIDMEKLPSQLNNTFQQFGIQSPAEAWTRALAFDSHRQVSCQTPLGISRFKMPVDMLPTELHYASVRVFLFSEIADLESIVLKVSSITVISTRGFGP